MLGTTAENSRQLLHRAKVGLAEGRRRPARRVERALAGASPAFSSGDGSG
jgi:hypothetical protein